MQDKDFASLLKSLFVKMLQFIAILQMDRISCCKYFNYYYKMNWNLIKDEKKHSGNF